MPTAGGQAFCQALVTAVPELQSAFTEHVEYFEELLPHVFFWDVCRYVEDLLAVDGDGEALRRLLTCLEKGLADGDADVDNLIRVSLIENFPAMDALRQRAGPVMQKAIDDFVNWRPSASPAPS